MTTPNLKKLFRKFIKVVPGGPVDKTRGTGMLTILDALADEVAATSLYYPLADAIALRDAANLPLGRPLVCLQSNWNGRGDTVVYVHVLEADSFAPQGWLYDNGVLSWADIDLDANTATPYGPQLGRVVTQQQALDLAAANKLDAGTYIVLDNWNGAPGGVLLTPISKGVFGTIGYIYQSRAIPVVADLYALTYKLLDLEGSQFLSGTYTIQPADLPEPKITVPDAALFASVGIAGAQGSLNPLAYGSGYTSAGNVLTILAAANAQAGEVVHYAYLAGAVAAPAPSELRSQHTTYEGLRVTGPFQFPDRRPSRLSITITSNVAMVAAQVNYRDTTRDGIWIAGQVYTSTGNSPTELADLLAEVEADIAAVPALALAIAAEVIFRTQPIDSTLESDFFLSGLLSGPFYGRASFFRTNYTGPPLGQVLKNSQFTDASAWDVPYGGATIGNGQANLFGRTTGDHLIELHQAQTIQSGDYFFELEVLQLDKGSVTLKLFQNGSALGTWPVFAAGRFRYDVTLPTSGPYDVYLHSFDAGIIISHVYLVPK